MTAKAKKDSRTPAEALDDLVEKYDTPPTEQGQRLLRECLRLHGSLSRTARKCDLHYDTLHRRIYGSPSSIDNETISKFGDGGIHRDFLLT